MSEAGEAFVQINLDDEAARAKLESFSEFGQTVFEGFELTRPISVDTSKATASVEGLNAAIGAIPKAVTVKVGETGVESTEAKVEALNTILEEVTATPHVVNIAATEAIASLDQVTEAALIAARSLDPLGVATELLGTTFANAEVEALSLAEQVTALGEQFGIAAADEEALALSVETMAAAFRIASPAIEAQAAELRALAAAAEESGAAVAAAGGEIAAGEVAAGAGASAALGPIGLIAGAFALLSTVLSRAVTRIEVKETVKAIEAVPDALDPASVAVDKFKDKAGGLGKALNDLNTAIVNGLSNKGTFTNNLFDLNLGIKNTADILAQFGTNVPPTFEALSGAASAGLNKIKDSLGLTGDAATKFQAIFQNAITPAKDTGPFGISNAIFGSGDQVNARYAELIRQTGLTKEQIDKATTSIRIFQDSADAVNIDDLERGTIKATAATSDFARQMLDTAVAFTGLNVDTTTGTDLTKLYTYYQGVMAHGLNGSGDALDHVSSGLENQSHQTVAAKAALDNFNAGLRASAQAVLDLDNQLAATQAADSLSFLGGGVTAPDFSAVKDAFATLDGPVQKVTDEMSAFQAQLDKLTNPKLDLTSAQVAFQQFVQGLEKTKNSIDITTKAGAKNVADIVTTVKDAQDIASKAFLASGGNAAIAKQAYSDAIDTARSKFKSLGLSEAAFNTQLKNDSADPATFKVEIDQGTLDQVNAEIAKIAGSDTLLAATIAPAVDPASAATAQAQLDALTKVPPVIFTPQEDPNGVRGVQEELIRLSLARLVAINPAAAPELVAKAKADIDAVANAEYPATISVNPDTLDLVNTAAAITRIGEASYAAVIETTADTIAASTGISAITSRDYQASVHVGLASGAELDGAIQNQLNSRSYTINVSPHTGAVVNRSAAGNHVQRFDRGGMPDIASAPPHYVTPAEAMQGPYFMYGEPSTKGEYFLSGDPAYRSRNIDLWEQAGRDFGVFPQITLAAPAGPATTSPTDAKVIAELRRMVATLKQVRDMPPMLVPTVSDEPNHVASKMHWAVQARAKHLERVRGG